MGNLITIRQSRVRSLDRHLTAVPPGSTVNLAIRITDELRARLEPIGLSSNPMPGDRVLPAGHGPISHFNAEGREIIRRDLPMEQAYRQALWKWDEWHGRHTVEREKIVDIPYWRYPRDFVPPPSVELRVAATEAGELFVVVDGAAYIPANEADLLHRVNLMLELFGEVELRQQDLTPFVSGEIRRLNWEVLPAGRHPWQKVREAIEPVLERAKAGNRPVIQARLDTIGFYGPKVYAIGNAGFTGYLVFGFKDLGLYVLESALYGNATYVLGADWERLSQMSKAELLDGALHKERIVHRADSWPARIRELLAPALEDQAA